MLHKKKSPLFIFPIYEQLAQQLNNLLPFDKYPFLLERFSNEELHVSLLKTPHKQTSYILGSIAPLETNLIAFMLLCHTLKKEKVEKVIGIIPYLSYSRQDRDEPLKSQALDLVGKVLAASGLDEMITLDIHNPNANLLPFPVHSISTSTLFAEEIKRQNLEDSTIVSPDWGAIQRSQDVASQLGRTGNLVVMKKIRSTTEIIHQQLHTKISKQAIVIDDILDTGKTLISCCESLQKKGTKRIIIMATHGLFTGVQWKNLFNLGVDRIYCTDAYPLRKEVTENNKISILPIAPLLAATLKMEKM